MAVTTVDIHSLKKIAQELRVDVIRMLVEAGSGHPGGSLSAAEIVTALFFHKMRYRPRDPFWPDRDRFVLTKGHCCPILYAALARAGYFPKEELLTLRKIGSRLQGHPYPGPPGARLPGVEAATGSLGQGLSIAIGVALAGRLAKKVFRVYALLGDGECQAGQVWEAAMLAPKHRLDNLCAIVDENKIQNDEFVEQTLSLRPFGDKWQTFGWRVIEAKGHDLADLLRALDEAETVKERPTVIIADTVKGKGVSFMEGNPDWHGKAPTHEEGERAIQEILASLV
jgi:transketolase